MTDNIDYLKDLFDVKSFEDMAKKLDDQPDWLSSCQTTYSFIKNNLHFKKKYQDNPYHKKSIRIQISNRSFGDDD